MEIPKYHPKAAFALFLNQAEHNLEKALKEITNTKEFKNSDQIEKCINNLSSENFIGLENKYFKFLRLKDNSKYFEDEIKNISSETEKQEKIIEVKQYYLLFIYQKLNNFRNFYSHFYHRNYDKNKNNIFEIKEATKEEKYLKEFLEQRFEDAKEFYSEQNRTMPDNFKHKYETKNLEHLKINDNNENNHYKFFNYNPKNNNFYFDNGEKKHTRRNYKSTVFLASFFLTKRQTNLFISQIRGFKGTGDENNNKKYELATRDVFTHFCMKNDSDFKSGNTDVRFFTDAFTHLSKVPRLAIENFRQENVDIKITYDIIKKTNDIIFIENRKITNEKKAKEKAIQKLQKIQEGFKKLEIIKNKTFETVTKLKTKIDELIKNDIEKIIGTEKYENYKDILINFALNDVQIRTSKDRFTEFALQYIDDFELFEKIRFKIYSGRVFEIRHEKKYHGGTKFERNFKLNEKIYSRINEIEKTQLPVHCPIIYTHSESKKVENVEVYDKAQEPQYFIRNNNIFFEAETKYGKQKASMSVHELRNLSFASMTQGKNVENKIIEYIESYQELLNEILSVENPAEINTEIPNKELPNYIVKYLKQENTESYKTRILNRLKFIQENTEKQKKNIKTLRKYEKISEIVKFVNRFNAELRGDKRAYLNVNQHQELEKLLGTFPRSEKELLFFLKDNNITTQYKNFKDFIESKPNLDSVLYKVFGTYIGWTKKSIKKIEKSKDENFLKSVAKIINVSEPDYSFERVKQNIEKLLTENIVIPRGFIKKRFFGGNGLSNIIDQKVNNEEACTYWEKLEDVYSIAQNATEEKRKKYKIAKNLNEQRLKDKVLFLMAKKYLEEKITKTENFEADSLKSPNLTVSNKIGSILKDGIEIKKKIDGQYKTLKFGINEFDRMPGVLNDKRLPKILKNYLPHIDEIYLINKEKYDTENTFLESLRDLQDAFQKIEEQQLQVIDAILKKEEEILFEYLSKEAEKIGILPRYVERYINRTSIGEVLNKYEYNKFVNEYREKIDDLIEPLLADGNRIETAKLFSKSNISFTDNNNEAGFSIRHYRNAAFHNALPDTGTFEEGIKLIKYKKNMVEKIKLKNFKCFKETEGDFGKITLLTGANSSGKSSFIDALLSVMQTEKFPVSLDINGKYKNSGGFTGILHNHEGDFIDIGIDFTNINRTNDTWKISTKWQKANNSALPSLNFFKSEYKINNEKKYFEISKLNDFNYKLESENFNNEYTYIKDTLRDISEESLFGDKNFPVNWLNKKFNYIDSYRESPYEYYKQTSFAGKIEPTGKGYVQQIAEWEDNEKAKIGLLTNVLKKLKLLHSIKTVKQEDGNFKVYVKVHKNSTEVPLRNVGYGVSKILPLIVADLQLENHSLLAMSEPEIDLHPSVQADFAEYLVKQSNENQKQYLVETHSEYIINRLRLLISKGEIKEDDIKVYFFENNGIETKTYSVKFLKSGQITGAPDGFFETYEQDVINIALQD